MYLAGSIINALAKMLLLAIKIFNGSWGGRHLALATCPSPSVRLLGRLSSSCAPNAKRGAGRCSRLCEMPPMRRWLRPKLCLPLTWKLDDGANCAAAENLDSSSWREA